MKKSKKTLLVSALSAVAFTSLTIGTTFALFTDEAKTEVEIKAGKVNVSAALKEAKTYSAEYDPQGDILDEEGATYKHVEQLEEQGKHWFANGGWATFAEDGSAINIVNITPGDKVEFSFSLANSSNVDVKYRISFVLADNNQDLAKGLTTSIQRGNEAKEEFQGLVKYASAWEILHPATTELGDLNFTLELPMNKGNIYQEKTANFTLKIQEVQANAYREGEKEVITVMEDVVSEPKQAVADAPTVIEASTPEAPVSKVTVTLPANAAYEGDVVEAGDNLTIEVKDLTVKEEGVEETSLDFDVTVKNNGEVINNFVEDVQVTLDVGEDRTVTGLSHNGQPVEGFTYDPATGLLVFKTKSFSPFRVSLLEGAGVSVFNEQQLRAALLNGGRIAVMNDIDVASAGGPLEVIKDTELLSANGYAIKSKANRVLWIDNSEVTFSAKNLQFDGCDISQRGLQVNNEVYDVTMNLENVKVYGVTHYAINLCSNSTVDLEINNCEIQGWAALNMYSDGYTINVNNSKLIGINDKPVDEDGWNNFGVVVLEGDTTGQTDAHSSNNTVTLRNTEVVAKSINANIQFFFLFNNNSASNRITCDNVLLTKDEAVEDTVRLVQDTGIDNIFEGTYHYAA